MAVRTKPVRSTREREAVISEKINTVFGFVEQIVNLPADARKVRVFRGHSKTSYRLKPSLYRNIKHAKDEKNIFRELVSMHPGEFQSDKSVFEHLVRMQHYNLETRLLDVSYNPLVGLYFAACNNQGSDGDVVCFEIDKYYVKYFDSDAVSCIANLSNLTSSERNALRKLDDVATLNESEPGKRLLQFIRAEKPYFLPLIDPNDLRSVFLVKPRLSNRRILSQQGAFLIFGLNHELVDPDVNNFSIRKFTISASAKAHILKQLDLININESTMYPDIEHSAKYIMSKLTPVEDA